MNLLPYQIEAVEKSMHFLQTSPTHACYNACEQGLGKTIMAVEVMNRLKPHMTVIVCPAVVRLNWEEEIQTWSNIECLNVIAVIETVKELKGAAEYYFKTLDISYEHHVIIMSYAVVHTPAALELFKNLHIDLLILDEAHYLKSSKAKRTKAVFKELWPKCKYKYALSGTPFTTEVVDGYTMFHACAPTIFPNFLDFTKMYSYKRMTPWGPKFYGVRNTEILSKLIRSNFYIRYRKDEVLKDLPDKIFQTIHLPESFSVTPKKAAKKTAKDFHLEDIKDNAVICSEKDHEANINDVLNEDYAKMLLTLEKKEEVKVTPALGRLLRLQGEAKVKPVAEFVAGLLEQDLSVVLFAYHTNVIEQLKGILADYNPVAITGATSPVERDNFVKAFQAGTIKLFIGQIQAAGIGITLTASSHCVIAETCWSPTTLAQAVDRLHRIGQKDTVNVYTFVVKGSWDEKMNQVTLTRAKNFKRVLDEVHA